MVEGVQRATERSREEWFAPLDGWGAAGRPYRVGTTSSGRTQVVVAHRRIADAATAAELKTYWRQRLAALKSASEEE